MSQETDILDIKAEARMNVQKEALLELTKDQSLYRGTLEEAARKITEKASEVLAAEVVSIWFFNEDGSVMTCIDLFQGKKKEHSSGFQAPVNSCPLHVKALENDRTIPANDARKDSRTNELNDSFIIPFGISSMLDATVRWQGKMVGAICHAHVGRPRQWTPDEQHFAASVADLIGSVWAAVGQKT